MEKQNEFGAIIDNINSLNLSTKEKRILLKELCESILNPDKDIICLDNNYTINSRPC